MIQKKIVQYLLLIVVLMATFSMQAQKALSVKENNGTETNFAVSSIRKITFYSGNMQILCSTGMKQYVLADLQYAAYIKLLFSVSAENVSLAATAGSKDSVTITSNVSWTASCDQTWLTITPTVLITGNAKVRLTAVANPTVVNRTATISLKIGDIVYKTISVVQAAGAATLGLSTPTIGTTKLANSNATVAVTSNTVWSAVSDQQWLTPTPTDSGNGTLTLTVEANPTTASRKATVTVSATGATSKTVTLTQAAGDASLSISATTASIAKDANSTATVDVTSNVTWTASTSQSWLSFSPTTNTGSATVTITAEANPSITTRTATVTISSSSVSSKTITVTQVAGSPSLKISANTASIANKANSTNSIVVTSNTAWTASSDNKTWLSFTPNITTSGTANLIFSASANTTVFPRTATVTLKASGANNQIVSVTQAAGDTVFTVSATSASVDKTAGSTATIDVLSNITWTASPDFTWLTVSPSSSTTGIATVTVSATENPSLKERTAIVSIKANNGVSQNISITQGAGDTSLTVSPTQSISATTTSTNVAVSSNTTWTASSNQAWLTISPSTPTANDGILVLNTTENKTIVARTAIVTILATGISPSKTITVTQAAGSATLTLSASTATLAKAAGSKSNVTVFSNTAWTANSSNSWLTLDKFDGTDTAEIVFTASENNGTTARTATISVSGTNVATQTITVTQTPFGIVNDQDGNAYKTVTIGTQTWMSENLKTNKYNDGSTIPNETNDNAWSALTTGAECTYDNVMNADTTNKYGRLYNWYAVNTGKLCPMGWHVPSDDEWITLEKYLIANKYNFEGNTTSDKVAKAMANSSGWNPYSYASSIGNEQTSNNASGFSALPSGYRNYSSGSFYYKGYTGYWWSSSEYDDPNSAHSRYLDYTSNTLYNDHAKKSTGYSVRCLNDNLTSLATLPSVTTTAISAITQATATSGGTVTTDGGAAITAQGVCWSTSHNPTIVDSKTIDVITNQTYTSSITGLTAITPYYVRAYATNSIGTAYGNEVMFTSSAFTLTVSSNTVTLPAAGGTATVTVASNATWAVNSNTSWLTVNQNTNSIKLTATPNTGAVRTASFSVIATGVKTQVITVKQADSIIVSKQIADTSFALGTLANKYVYANYFKYLGSGTITYSLSSDNSGIVNPINAGTSLGLVSYGTGSANITVTAKSTSGATASLHFKVTVSSTSTVDCTTLYVKGKTTDIKCSGDKTGAIQLLVIGGMKPYNYKWSNTFSDTYISNLQAGTYSVIVTDSNLCSVQKTFTITEPAKVAMNAILTAPTCSLSNGKIALSVSGGTSPYTYKWNDGTTNSELSNKSAGQYVITITDNEACVQTETFDLSNTNAPIISLDSVVSSKCTQSNGKIALTVTGGTSPLSFNWNDNATTEDRDAISSGNYSLTVNDAAGCKATFKAVVPSKSFAQPTIALVTVSDSTGKNLVVWQKENTDAIKQYNIYREGDKAGFYEKIGDVQYADTSIYKDETANPQEQSWRYKISATDYCNNESPLSAEHKTIHLQKNQGMGKTINLAWDSYEGLEFYTYIIYRYSKSKGVEILKKVPASINSKSDLEPPSDVKSYSIGIELPDSIYPSKFKSDSGPFSVSLSNMAESELVGISTPVEEQVTISPNPANVNVTIAVASQQQFSFEIVDVLGRVVVAQSAIGSVKLDCTSFTKGVYFVKVLSGDSVTTNTLVVE